MMQSGMEVVQKLETEAATLKYKVEAAEKALAEYQRTSKFIPPTKDGDSVTSELIHARANHADAQSRARRANETLAALKRHKAAGKTLRSFPTIASDPQIRQGELELLRLRR